MASGLYLEAVKRLLGGGTTPGFLDIASNSTSIFVMLVDNSYTFDVSHSLLTAINSARIDKVGGDLSVTADTLLDPTLTTSGNIVAVDATGIVITSISTGQTLAGIVIYNRVTTDADSIPICFISIAQQNTNGATININWDTGTNKIFSINATPA